MKRHPKNQKFILVKDICADCDRQEGQLPREEKWYCVRCYAKRFGEVVIKLDK